MAKRKLKAGDRVLLPQEFDRVDYIIGKNVYLTNWAGSFKASELKLIRPKKKKTAK